MLKLAFKGLFARKLRTVLTGFAVVLGVAFVAGTFVFTDTIDASFKDLFERTSKGVDVSVQSHLAVEADFAAPPTMAAGTLDRVRSVSGVEEADGSVSGDVNLLDDQGKAITSNGPPTIAVTTGADRFDPLTYVEGGKPTSADQIAIDKSTADKYGWKPGDKVTVAGRAPAKAYTVSGVATLGDSENLAGSRLVVFTLPEGQKVTGHDGYDDISVAAAGGTSPEELKAAIARELGPEFAVRTGKEQAEKQAQDLSDALGFIRTALLVFAAVALLVGSFLIFNTFSVTVAQRTKEFALLRTLGASRGQVPRTVIAGLLVGVVATVVSGFMPARRATRIDPVAAMRDSITPGVGKVRRRRIVVALVVEAIGVALLLYGLLGDPGGATATVLGLGTLLMIFGFALLAPTLVRPLSALIGKPLARFQGLTGMLARENSRRQPQRTAVTASALMIGVALVVLVAIFAAGLRATIDQGVDEQVKAASIVTHQDGFSPLPAGITEPISKVEGVTAVSRIRFATGRIVGETGNTSVTGIDPDTASDVVTLKWKDGDDAVLSKLGTDAAAITKDFADQHDLKVGSELKLTAPRGNEVGYRVAGIYEPGAGVIGGVLVSNQSLEADWDAKDIAFVLVGGDDAAAIKRGEDAALTGFPVAKPQTIEGFKDEQNKQVNTLVGLVYALLSLSVIVALLGIVNTLALSVHERTRELGLLRAVGMSRRQVRRMVRAESVITAAIVSRPLAEDGFVFELPVGTLIAVVILASIAGVLAAIQPARRAAKVDVLRAVTTE